MCQLHIHQTEAPLLSPQAVSGVIIESLSNRTMNLNTHWSCVRPLWIPRRRKHCWLDSLPPHAPNQLHWPSSLVWNGKNKYIVTSRDALWNSPGIFWILKFLHDRCECKSALKLKLFKLIITFYDKYYLNFFFKLFISLLISFWY